MSFFTKIKSKSMGSENVSSSDILFSEMGYSTEKNKLPPKHKLSVVIELPKGEYRFVVKNCCRFSGPSLEVRYEINTNEEMVFKKEVKKIRPKLAGKIGRKNTADEKFTTSGESLVKFEIYNVGSLGRACKMSFRLFYVGKEALKKNIANVVSNVLLKKGEKDENGNLEEDITNKESISNSVIMESEEEKIDTPQKLPVANGGINTNKKKNEKILTSFEENEMEDEWFLQENNPTVSSNEKDENEELEELLEEWGVLISEVEQYLVQYERSKNRELERKYYEDFLNCYTKAKEISVELLHLFHRKDRSDFKKDEVKERLRKSFIELNKRVERFTKSKEMKKLVTKANLSKNDESSDSPTTHPTVLQRLKRSKNKKKTVQGRVREGGGGGGNVQTLTQIDTQARMKLKYSDAETIDVHTMIEREKQEALIEVETQMNEVVDLLRDTKEIVDQQDDTINIIGDHTDRAIIYVDKGRREIKKAHKMQKLKKEIGWKVVKGVAKGVTKIL